MGEYMLLIGTIVIVAIVTSVVFVLQVQRQRFRVFTARQVEWENAQKHSLQIWEIQQEKREIELAQSLKAHMQRVRIAWEAWEAHDTSRIASTSQQSNATILHTKLEQEIARLPYIDEVPLKKLD